MSEESEESEEFDKEAEKEKLRQQLADEEEARKSTQHMSELLLKGATMTNRHCENCGDPLFRHEGREFCPTCGRQSAPSDQQAPGEAGSADRDDAEAAGDGGTAAQAPDAGQQPAGAQQPVGAQRPDGRAATPSTSQQPRPASGGEADVPAAREALARTVTALARQAEATADVGRTRELLAAVREGAEALRALDDVGR